MTGAAFVARYRLVETARMARLTEWTARRTLAEVIADLVSEWPRAGNVVLISEWLERQDLHWRTPEQLALDWLWRNGFVDHGAPRRAG